jgi:hypothetical protein
LFGYKFLRNGGFGTQTFKAGVIFPVFSRGGLYELETISIT